MRILRRLAKAALVLALLLIALLIAAAASAFYLLRHSLPDYDAAAAIPGLAAPVTIERDALAVPTITARSRADAAAALGFVHAQDRFFQMDISRRVAAGRLAALLGPPGVGADERLRLFGFDDVAEAIYDDLPPEHRALIDAYTRGVNAGLSALPARPPEYLVLLTTPEPWRPTDCLLVSASMHLGLSLFNNAERQTAVMRDALPDELTDFLTPSITAHDAPLIPDPPSVKPPPIPGPDAVNLRAATSAPAPHLDDEPPPAPGSNSFAVAPARTANDRAILANDMHLGIDVPNTWYRAQLKWIDSARGQVGGVGVTLPGVPGIVVGSNTHVAWGFTNVTGDFADFILVETLDADPDRYRTPEGDEPFTTASETIEVRAAPPVTLEIRQTRWGPVYAEDHRGRPLVLQWTATDPARNNLAILDMDTATTLDEAIDVVRRWKGPPQNVLLAASDGRIAWLPAGDVPIRRGFDGSVPFPRTDLGVGWFGALPESLRPIVVDPPDAILFTANARTLPPPAADVLARNWAPPYRAARIRDLLAAQSDFTERSLLGVALDTRVEPYDFYRQLVLDTIPLSETDPDLAAARAAAESWSGCADPNATGLALLVALRSNLRTLALTPLTEPCRALDESFQLTWLNTDAPLRRLLEAQPPHLLNPEFESWEALVTRAIALAAVATDPAAPWSASNRADIRHPLSKALGLRIPRLDMPADPLPGHRWAVRTAAPTFGASQRLVVAPGHEADAVLHMPTGQCAHPLSPHHADMHRDWLEGRPTPLLPGPTVYTTVLTP